MNIGKYGKTVTAVITGLIGWASLVVNSSSTDITASEWIVLATALATALGVYAISNASAPPLDPKDFTVGLDSGDGTELPDPPA